MARRPTAASRRRHGASPLHHRVVQAARATARAVGPVRPRCGPPAAPGGTLRRVVVLEVVLWASLALILWTHVGYPLLAALLARVARRPVRADDVLPRLALVITAYNEADVIAAKLEDALALDYPRDRLRIVVTSDASNDGTDDIVRGFADRGVELVVAPRGGKVNAQNVAVAA